MLLVEEEGTASTFQALGEVIGEHGLFCALYTIAAAITSITRRLAIRSRRRNKQVGRAYRISGSSICGLFAAGARALERMLARCRAAAEGSAARRIRTVEAANAWLKAHYIASITRRLRSKPSRKARRSLPTGTKLGREALCVIEEDRCQRQYHRMGRWRLQLPQSRLRPTSSRPWWGS